MLLDDSVFNVFIQLVHNIAWRFIFSAVLISPFVLTVIALRGKFSPKLRSMLLGACFWGLLLPFQRSSLYLSDGLFLFIRHLASARLLIPSILGKENPYILIDVFEIISVVWLVGFLLFYALRCFDYSKTVRMFRAGKIQGCASYFYRFRSRIYLPPGFELTYTPYEQEMLMAHERRHIAQHDPFVYRLLVIVECVCWFNPLISIAVRHYQHERELLCDERVTRSYQKYDYGMLILKAAEEKTAVRAATAGIVMEYGSIPERVTAMVKPAKTVGKWTAAVLIGLTVIQFSIGFMGFRPAYRNLSEYSPAIVDEEYGLTEVGVYEIESFEAPVRLSYRDPQQGERMEGLESFVTATEERLSVDEAGMYRHALALGLTDESCLRVVHVLGLSLDMGGVNTAFSAMTFKVGDLKTQVLEDEYLNETNWFMFLTDVFI